MKKVVVILVMLLLCGCAGASSGGVEASSEAVSETYTSGHIVFKNTAELHDFLIAEDGARSEEDISFDYFTRGGEVVLYEPANVFEGFELGQVDIWSFYCSYTFRAAGAEPLGADEADFEALYRQANDKIVIQWCAQASEDPLAGNIARFQLLPVEGALGYYYKELTLDGQLLAYGVYWAEKAGEGSEAHLLYAHIPVRLFSAEDIMEICAVRRVSLDLE